MAFQVLFFTTAFSVCTMCVLAIIGFLFNKIRVLACIWIIITCTFLIILVVFLILFSSVYTAKYYQIKSLIFYYLDSKSFNFKGIQIDYNNLDHESFPIPIFLIISWISSYNCITFGAFIFVKRRYKIIVE